MLVLKRDHVKYVACNRRELDTVVAKVFSRTVSDVSK